VIADVDQALTGLLRQRLGDGVTVSFAPPGRVEAELGQDGSVGPVLDLHLLEVHEEGAMKTSGLARGVAEDGTVVRLGPPRWFRLTYWLTAWARDAGTEHQALGDALAALSTCEAIPDDLLGGALAGRDRPVRLEVAMPAATDDFAAGVWRSLRLPMKGALHVAVLAPVAPVEAAPRAKPVQLRHLRMTGPPPKPEPAIMPPPAVPAVLVPGGIPKPPALPVAPAAAVPAPIPKPPSVPPAVAPPSQPAPEEAPAPPRVVEEVVYAPDPDAPPRAPA